MALLSLCEINQSQLSQTPIISGQLVCCTDTGNFYKDNANNTRTPLGTDIICVTSLPLAPLSEKIYLLKPNKLYLFDGEWFELNKKEETIIPKSSLLEFPSVGKENCIYIDTDKNKTYRWSSADTKYYCIGSDYTEIKVINGGSASSN